MSTTTEAPSEADAEAVPHPQLGQRSDNLPPWAEAAVFPGMVAYRRGDHALGLGLLGLATGGLVLGLVGTSYGALAVAQLGTKAVLGSSALGIVDALVDRHRSRQLQRMLAAKAAEKKGG